MTQDLLESDIELAKTLMGASHSDPEIVAALKRRGLDPERAARLVSDLRHGRPIVQAMSLVARGGSRRSEPPPPFEAETDQMTPAPGEARRSHRERPSSATGPVLAGVLIGVVVTVLAYFLYPYVHQATGVSTLPVAAHGAAAGGAPAVGPDAKQPPQALAASCTLQLGPRGLEVCGGKVTRKNALAALSKCLGAPTRTNRVADANQVVYAYDRHGVLIYDQTDGAEASLVIDFQARGGDHSARMPFSGTFRIGGTLVEANTDAKALASIASLELNNAGPEGGLFGAKYNNLELFFAYRATADRLNQIQINLE